MVEEVDGKISLVPMFGVRGMTEAYLKEMERIGGDEFALGSEVMVGLYNDPSRIFVPDLSTKASGLRGRGVKAVACTGDDVLRYRSYLEGWMSFSDFLAPYLSAVASAIKRADENFSYAIGEKKIESILAGQPASVQSIYGIVVARTKEWKEKKGYYYGVPIDMIVSEVGLKEVTVREYLNRLEDLHLTKKKVIGKEIYYQPVER